jgi:hypothetical protein
MLDSRRASKMSASEWPTTTSLIDWIVDWIVDVGARPLSEARAPPPAMLGREIADRTGGALGRGSGWW